MSRSRKNSIYPLVAVVVACAAAAFWAGFSFETEGDAGASRQISKLRGGPVDIYTKEALRKEFAALPR